MKHLVKCSMAALLAAGLSFPALAADKPEGKPDAKAAMEKAEADYKAAVAECKKKKGDEAKACMDEAKAAKEKAVSEAKAAK